MKDRSYASLTKRADEKSEIELFIPMVGEYLDAVGIKGIQNQVIRDIAEAISDGSPDVLVDYVRSIRQNNE